MAIKRITRFSVAASASLFLASGLASCSGDSMDNPGGMAGVFGAGAFPGAGATGGTSGAIAGSATTGAGTSSFAGTSSNGAGGSNASGGSGSGTAGGVSGGATGAGGTSAQPPCVDVPPMAAPGQPPNENCDNAMEYNWCGADWNKGQFCRKTCGDCTDGSGGTGSGGSSNGTAGAGGSVVTGPTLPDVTGGPEYHASRYWDCCKTHCATNAGAPSCGKDGVSSNNGQSSCQNGPAYACYNEAPRALGSHLSYGHVAKRSANCGACYQIQFTGQGFYSANDPGSKLIAGKQMIVKVSNTGNDVADQQFDLMIPGGGVGQNTQGCINQWGQIDFGVTYGGFYSGDPQNAKCNSGTHAQKKACVKALCGQLPAGDARDGCNWWVDWLELADNPKFRFKETQCPNDI